MIIVGDNSDEAGPPLLLEFQGEFENLDLFDGVLDRTSLQMRFNGFYLQGKIVRKQMTLMRKEDGEDGALIQEAGVVEEVILFSSPPRYIIKHK